MLDLNRFETFCRRIYIRDREGLGRVPFVLRSQQQRIIEQFKDHLSRKRRLYGIFLKARRVGVSTLASALQVAHCAAQSDAHAAIIAQIATTARDLFKQASGFAKDMRPINPDIELGKAEVKIGHQFGPESTLQHFTAATVHGTRGLTFSSIHMTEAAFYPYEGAYTAILNTLSQDPNNICLIETTANGMEGPGQSYYEAWQAAESGESEFLPVFLPWWEDPDYVRDPEEGEAPYTDYEKWMMKDVKDSRTGKRAPIDESRIAWHRWALVNKCEGSLDRWRQEYPSTPEEAFVATGQPAFTVEETQFAQKHQSNPAHYGTLAINPITAKVEFRAASHPDESLLLLWEFPQPSTHYFFGVDTARGDAVNTSPGDFASIVGWNGETGAMCLRYAARVSPETLSEQCNLVGRFYNNACLNVEINNLGYVVMKELRDKWFYPTQYRWKGRDDKYDGKSGNALGFETTERYRKMMFNIFRTSLYKKEVIPKDHQFISQMIAAKMEMGWRWEIAVGHDDIFMAGLLGWFAREQYHPLPCNPRAPRNILLTPDELVAAQIAFAGKSPGAEANRSLQWDIDSSSTVLGALLYNSNEHLRRLEKYAKMKGRTDRLAGI